MSPYRVAAKVLVIGAGLVGSYLIIRNSIPPAPLGQAEDTAQGGKPLAQKPVKWLEEAAKFLNEPAKNLADSGSFLAENENKAANTKENGSVNLTELVAKTMFGQMQGLDQSDKNPFQGQGFDPNDPESQKLIAQAVAGLGNQNDFFNVSVDDKDLKISNDNSREAKIKYFVGIVDISNIRLGNPGFKRSPDQIINDINADCFSGGSKVDKSLADIYPYIVQDYLNLAVPPDFIELHKELTAHVKSANLIYQALANCSNDPIRGYLAAQALPQLVQEMVKSFDIVREKYKEINL